MRTPKQIWQDFLTTKSLKRKLKQSSLGRTLNLGRGYRDDMIVERRVQKLDNGDLLVSVYTSELASYIKGKLEDVSEFFYKEKEVEEGTLWVAHGDCILAEKVYMFDGKWIVRGQMFWASKQELFEDILIPARLTHGFKDLIGAEEKSAREIMVRTLSLTKEEFEATPTITARREKFERQSKISEVAAQQSKAREEKKEENEESEA